MNRSDHDDEGKTENGDPPTTQDAPYIAKLVAPAGDIAVLSGQADATTEYHQGVADDIRIGSPFRDDPDALQPAVPSGVAFAASGEAAYGEFGPFLYTAMGASSAAVVVLLFAAAGAFWFPAGGALVAVLGTVLSIVGLFSARRFRYAALVTLPLHMILFFFCYARSLG